MGMVWKQTQELKAALEGLHRLLRADTPWDDPDTQATLSRALELLLSAKEILSLQKAELERIEGELADLFPKHQPDIDGWRVTRRPKQSVRWDTRRGLSAVVARAFDEAAEDVERAPEIVEGVLSDVLGIGYFRTGKAQEWGLDPSPWKEVERKGYRLQAERAVEEPGEV